VPDLRIRRNPLSLIRDKIGEVGFAYTLYLILLRVSSPRVFESKKFFVITCDLPPCGSRPPSAEGFREAAREDMALFTRFGDSEREIRHRFALGRRVWVIERGGRFLACDWLGGSVRHVSDWFLLEGSEGDVWSSYIAVDKEYRGMGLGPLLKSLVLQECARLGFKRGLGSIATLNRISVRALSKVGYKPIGRVFFLSLLGFSAVRCGSKWRFGTWSRKRPLRVSLGEIAEPACHSHWQAILASPPRSARRRGRD